MSSLWNVCQQSAMFCSAPKSTWQNSDHTRDREEKETERETERRERQRETERETERRERQRGERDREERETERHKSAACSPCSPTVPSCSPPSCDCYPEKKNPGLSYSSGLEKEEGRAHWLLWCGFDICDGWHCSYRCPHCHHRLSIVSHTAREKEDSQIWFILTDFFSSFINLSFFPSVCWSTGKPVRVIIIFWDYQLTVLREVYNYITSGLFNTVGTAMVPILYLN